MRRTAVTIGALFWISNLVTLIGVAITGTVPTSAAALATMSPDPARLTAGTLIAQINGVAIIAYAVLLFPWLKREHQRWAIGYLSFKIAEALLLAMSAAALLSLIPLTQHAHSSAGTAAAFDATATVTLAQQFWTARLAALAYLVATPVLNFALLRTRLVPPFLPIWGFAALVLLAAGMAMGVGDPNRGLEPAQLLVIPIILWELTFATWLMVRGFAQVSADAVLHPVHREGEQRHGEAHVDSRLDELERPEAIEGLIHHTLEDAVSVKAGVC